MNKIRNVMNNPKIAIAFVLLCILFVLLMFLLKAEKKSLLNSGNNFNIEKPKIKDTHKKSHLQQFSYYNENPFHRGVSQDTLQDGDDVVDDFEDLELSFIMKKNKRSYAILNNKKYFVGSKFKRYTLLKINRAELVFIDSNKKKYFVNMY